MYQSESLCSQHLLKLSESLRLLGAKLELLSSVRTCHSRWDANLNKLPGICGSSGVPPEQCADRQGARRGFTRKARETKLALVYERVRLQAAQDLFIFIIKTALERVADLRVLSTKLPVGA